jgi:predicted CXXCH cytochrome family protein
MKHSVVRPLLVVLLVVALILLARVFIVPHDFIVSERGYRFGWHRLGNEQDWKNFKVKYAGSDYCAACHADNAALIQDSPHAKIQCENCHGPALGHPDNPPKLQIDTSRDLCLRCHNVGLAYATSGRAKLRGVDPDTHNPGVECSMCHNPHHPNLEGKK